MIKVLFICHGNICRSPLAHLYFQDFVKKQGLADKFYVDSAAIRFIRVPEGSWQRPEFPVPGSMPVIWKNKIIQSLII